MEDSIEDDLVVVMVGVGVIVVVFVRGEFAVVEVVDEDY